jgi:glycine betaine/proline transport system permease protein
MAEIVQSGSFGSARAPRNGLILAVFALAILVASPFLAAHLPAALVDYPKSAIIPLSAWVGDNLNWLARKASIGPVRIADITRALAAILELPIDALNTILAVGIKAGRGDQVHVVVPPLSWLAAIGLAGIGAQVLGGLRMAALTVLGLFYLVVFGFWADAMMTLSSVVISTIASIALGIWIGTFALRKPSYSAPVEALMNVMQTVPIFSYLVPTLLFLGYGPSAALVATAIYALPPMVHATMLGLRNVPPEVIEYGKMAGASPRAMFWKIKLPVALPTLSIGINQTIMACLNMVVIASMIGAGGLGYVVLLALRKLDIGGALEAGLAIVVLAVILDRLSLAAAKRNAAGAHLAEGAGRKAIINAAVWFSVATIVALAIPAFQTWPKDITLTTAPWWNALVSWINIHWFVPLDAFRSFLLINVMNPAKNALLALPWMVFIGVVALLGAAAGGLRVAAIASALLAFVALTGFWDAGVTSIYLISLGVIVSLIIGFPIGYVVSKTERRRQATGLVLDTLQTLPTLVYLLPAVMLFRNGDFSALIAIVSYAIAPAIRYAMHAFAAVPEDRLEAAAMSGASPWQTMKWVRLPAAFPTLILGLNQTVMMAISMLVITALVGTRDLGQQVFIALSRAKVGDGIVAGLCVAAIALAADVILKAFAAQKARAMGASLIHG